MRFFSLFQLISVIWGVLIVSCDSITSNEVWALTAFKEAIYEDPSLVLSNWNALDSDPCNWSGIFCSQARDQVIALNLSSSSLRGFLAPELGLLSSLKELILHKNNLLGTIPKEIGMLNNLKVLDLGMNQLSGPIPGEIGGLSSVMKIDLHSNGLTGNVPFELGNLRNLVQIRLDRNKLQGTLPGNNITSTKNGIFNVLIVPAVLEELGCDSDMKIGVIEGTQCHQQESLICNQGYILNGDPTGFCRASRFENADFSFNFFSGRVPKCLEYLPRSNFQGNCFWDKNPKQRSPQQCGATSSIKTHPKANAEHGHSPYVSKHQGGAKPSWLLALEIITGSTTGFLLLFAIVTAIKRCKGQSPVIIPWKKASTTKDQMIIYIDSELLKDVKRWSRHELEVACEDFSNIIDSSPDSLVYKGIVKDGPEIAVISLCVKEENWTGYLELYFQREVADLARLNHENIGNLLGYCRESTPFSRMLVFGYASNGTINEHLHYGEECQLSWTRRMKIIIGIARGLRYLHTELQPPFTISVLSSSAVYLTEDFSPKIVDFENWKAILGKSEKNSGSIGNGDYACRFSDSLQTRHLDVQGNVFSFGLLLLEIISGRPQYCKDRGSLVDWAKEYLEQPEVMSYLVDPELRHFRYEELKVVCEVVNLCIQTDSSKRPSMQVLCSMLETRIDTSVSSELKDSPLAWAELAISS